MRLIYEEIELILKIHRDRLLKENSKRVSMGKMTRSVSIHGSITLTMSEQARSQTDRQII